MTCVRLSKKTAARCCAGGGFSVAEPKDGYPGGRLPPIRRASARGWFFVRRSSAQHVSSSEFDSTKFHHQKENKFEMKPKSPRKKIEDPFCLRKKHCGSRLWWNGHVLTVTCPQADVAVQLPDQRLLSTSTAGGRPRGSKRVEKTGGPFCGFKEDALEVPRTKNSRSKSPTKKSSHTEDSREKSGLESRQHNLLGEGSPKLENWQHSLRVPKKILRKAAHNLASFSEVAKFHLPIFGGLALGCIEADLLQLYIRFAAVLKVYKICELYTAPNPTC
jgi:hypothetical protein